MRRRCALADAHPEPRSIPSDASLREETEPKAKAGRTSAHGHGNRRLEATDARHRVLRRDATHTPDALRLDRHHRGQGHVKGRHFAFETGETRTRGVSSSCACFASAGNGFARRVGASSRRRDFYPSQSFSMVSHVARNIGIHQRLLQVLRVVPRATQQSVSLHGARVWPTADVTYAGRGLVFRFRTRVRVGRSGRGNAARWWMPSGFSVASFAAARCVFAHPFRLRRASTLKSPRHYGGPCRTGQGHPKTPSEGLGRRGMSGTPTVAAAADAELQVASDPMPDTDLKPIPPCVTGDPTVVCLGKFDAMHRGHRELAQTASAMGNPCLVSFGGMAEVLGWQTQLPITAPADRTHVLRKWREHCGGKPVGECVVPFSEVRQMSPEEFVVFLKDTLAVSGIVAGRDYRFGFRAKGTSDDLIELGARHGMDVKIVSLVPADEDDDCDGIESDTETGTNDALKASDLALKPSDRTPQVSSTRVRGCLLAGDVAQAARLLGRPHRLFVEGGGAREVTTRGNDVRGETIVTHTYQLTQTQNQYPGIGTYFGFFRGGDAESAPVEAEVTGSELKITTTESAFCAADAIAIDLVGTKPHESGDNV